MVIYECGICDHLHPWDWDGDCRDDANRLTLSGIEDDNGGVIPDSVEIRTWEERVEDDQKE